MRQLEKERFTVQEEMLGTYRMFIDGLEKSINLLERQIDEAAEMAEICTDEWCNATEHVIDDLHKALFSISEPHSTPKEYSKKLSQLRTRIRDLYLKYKSVKK